MILLQFFPGGRKFNKQTYHIVEVTCVRVVIQMPSSEVWKTRQTGQGYQNTARSRVAQPTAFSKRRASAMAFEYGRFNKYARYTC